MRPEMDTAGMFLQPGINSFACLIYLIHSPVTSLYPQCELVPLKYRYVFKKLVSYYFIDREEVKQYSWSKPVRSVSGCCSCGISAGFALLSGSD